MKIMRKAQIISTIIGELGIVETEGILTEVIFGNRIEGDYILEETELIRRTKDQINEYLAGKRKNFDIPYSLNGTEFQVKVWNALNDIPFGETRTYKDMAEYINHPKAYRAVGGANNKNPIPIIIP